ncbi:MAG: hypothetical protein A2798_02710 [Candidatus Levybacteria bacterium RIFCSPHIGHO2_01_FULL_37_17]|nr:MAG: hypothetical protein A2798_02710 [Candidatus Levybacteria bacterium RIFCSPHIGHO2_01_FULL_37_17]OGH36767.1 MAG: hypothetical protein A2959_00700 [Candidatus Levybacteria bacterium RIFCSPLOWO2_01_FULL_38_23]
MAIETINAEEEKRKLLWLKDLSEFIVEANLATWAGEGKEVEQPQRPGYKELEYPPQKEPGIIPQKGFYLRDSYTKYFRAPGMTTIYYNGEPAWAMSYGGTGMVPGYELRAQEVFTFLKHALKAVSPQLPFRGPTEFGEGRLIYRFNLLPNTDGNLGNLEDALWQEKIFEQGIGDRPDILLFTQTGIAGVAIGKGEHTTAIKPWNL